MTGRPDRLDAAIGAVPHSRAVQDEPAARASLSADVLSAFAVAALVVAVDLAGIVRRPPGVPVDTGLALFAAVGVALGGLLGAAVVTTRGALGRALARVGPVGASLAGAVDLGALYALVVFAQDPRDLQGEVRGPVLLGMLVLGAVVGSVLSAAPRRQRVLAVVALVVAAVLATRLRWLADQWTRLALHLVWVVAGTFLLRGLVVRHATPQRAAIAVACAIALLGAADPALRASASGRRALWGRSGEVYGWLFAVGRVVDRDGDEAFAWLGGVDCDPGRAAVHPGASERPGNGRDDDCVGGDVPRPPPAATPAGLAGATGAASAQPPDMLLLSLDSLRWDVAAELPAVRRALGPHVELSRAVSPAAKTENTLTAVLRGRPFREVELDDVDGVRGQVVWKDRASTLGHALTERGYRVVTVPTDAYLDPRYGISAGFEAVYASAHEAHGLGLAWSPFDRNRLRAAPALEVLLRVARQTPRPFCGWVHLMDSHFPFYWGRSGKGPGTLPGLRRSVRDLDGTLARFLDAFARARGRRPLVALFGDHGEELGEHGGSAHGSSVHAEQVRVTLLLAGDGVPAGRFDGPVSASSIAPTLLELAGIPVPASMTEPSLAGALRGARPWPELAVSESDVSGRSWVGYTGPRYRLLVEPEHDLVELYDADRDPLERHDLADARPDLVRAARRVARAWDEAH